MLNDHHHSQDVSDPSEEIKSKEVTIFNSPPLSLCVSSDSSETEQQNQNPITTNHTTSAVHLVTPRSKKGQLFFRLDNEFCSESFELPEVEGAASDTRDAALLLASVAALASKEVDEVPITLPSIPILSSTSCSSQSETPRQSPKGGEGATIYPRFSHLCSVAQEYQFDDCDDTRIANKRARTVSIDTPNARSESSQNLNADEQLSGANTGSATSSFFSHPEEFSSYFAQGTNFISPPVSPTVRPISFKISLGRKEINTQQDLIDTQDDNDSYDTDLSDNFSSASEDGCEDDDDSLGTPVKRGKKKKRPAKKLSSSKGRTKKRNSRSQPLQSPKSLKNHPIKKILRKKFSWKNYPELEAFLIANREEYLRHSALNYTTQQKQYNNRLTEHLLELASEHGYVFDEEAFSFVTVRDRIRCYFKSYVQSLKKRGVIIGYAAKKAGLVTDEELEKSAAVQGKIIVPTTPK